MPKIKKIIHKKTMKRKYKKTKNRTKRGGGFFDTIKKSIGIGNKDSGGKPGLVLDESGFRNKIEKKINLNTKLNYISEHFSYIIQKYWSTFLNKQIDNRMIGKIISSVGRIGNYDIDTEDKIVNSFDGITEIEEQDIRTCIKLLLFLDNIYEINDISSSFITKPQESGTLKTDIWDVLKGLVKEVSSEINFDDTYKQKREKQLNSLLEEYRTVVSIYKSDQPELPDPSVSNSSPETENGSPTPETVSQPLRSPSPRRNNRNTSLPLRSPSPRRNNRNTSQPLLSPSPRRNNRNTSQPTSKTHPRPSPIPVSLSPEPSPRSKISFGNPPKQNPLWESPVSKL